MKFYATGTFLLFAFLSLSTSTHAQDIYDGFIITEGDNYRYGSIQIDKSTQYEICNFKLSGKSEFKKYDPESIQGYGAINGIRYLTREVEWQTGTKKVFLKVESNGAVKLYSYNSRLFIERESLIELKLAGSMDFKSVLSQQLVNCKNIKSSIKSSKLTIENLKRIFLKYERCTTTKSESEPGVRIQTDILAGIEYNNTALKFKNYTLLNNKKLTDRTLLSIGANVNFTFKQARNISYIIGVFYYQQNFYLIQKTPVLSGTSTDKIDFNYNEIVIPVGLRYTLFRKEKNIMPYVKACVGLPATFKSNLTWQNRTEDALSVSFQQYDLPQQYQQSIQFGFGVGADFSIYSKLRNVIEVNYQKSGGHLNNDSFSVKSDRFTILLGIKF